MHGPGYSHESALTAAYNLPGGRRFSDDFHIFSIEWSRRAVRFYVDGGSYKTVAVESIPRTAQWVFDNPFFLLLNVAVGGNFSGPPDATTQFPHADRLCACLPRAAHCTRSGLSQVRADGAVTTINGQKARAASRDAAVNVLQVVVS